MSQHVTYWYCFVLTFLSERDWAEDHDLSGGKRCKDGWRYTCEKQYNTTNTFLLCHKLNRTNQGSHQYNFRLLSPHSKLTRVRKGSSVQSTFFNVSRFSFPSLKDRFKCLK